MRRKDREVKDRREIVEIMAACAVCRIGLATEGTPYIVPMNFGLAEENGRWVLYFHCANEGRKIELIGRGRRAAFEMDCRHALLGDSENPCVYSYAYASVIGSGWLEPIQDAAEKAAGLDALMRQQTGRSFSFTGCALDAVTVLKLTVEELSAKRRDKVSQ